MTNRNVATATRKPAHMVPASRPTRELITDLLANGREKLNPAISGLTSVTPTHAVLQALGDPTYYLVEITAAEALALGWCE